MGACKQNRVARLQGGKPQNHSGYPRPRQSTRNEKSCISSNKPPPCESIPRGGGSNCRRGYAPVRQGPPKSFREESPRRVSRAACNAKRRKSAILGVYVSKRRFPGRKRRQFRRKSNPFRSQRFSKSGFAVFQPTCVFARRGRRLSKNLKRIERVETLSYFYRPRRQVENPSGFQVSKRRPILTI